LEACIVTPPYEAHTIDAVLHECIGFVDKHQEDFSASVIAGRGTVAVDSTEVKSMLERIARWDGELLENLGFGKDNITYFRLGVAARRVMASGGVGALLRRQQLTRIREVWVPLVLSILAGVISIFAWLLPREATHKGVGEMKARLAALEQARVQQSQEILRLRVSMDSLRLGRSR
jgi:hypothetical protein